MAIVGKCKICPDQREFLAGFGLMGHLRNGHKLSRQQIYDTYCKKSDDGFCKNCGKEVSFYKNRKMWGYKKYCSLQCESVNSKLITKLNQDPKFRERMRLVSIQNGRNFNPSAKLRDSMSKRRSERNRSHKGLGYKKYPFSGYVMKSSWEVEFAKKCEILGVKWQYEPRTFVLAKDKRFRYTPDFYLPEHDKWVEIKPSTMMNAKVFEKRDLLAKLHDVELVIVNRNKFDELLINLAGG